LVKTVLKYLCLHPSESSTDSKIKDDPCFYCGGLCVVKFHGMLCSMMYLPTVPSITEDMHVKPDSLSYNGTEPCPLHDDIPLGLPTNVNDFQTNVLSLSITIRPNHQRVGMPRLG
jgi:hypothetical protein